MLFSTQRVFAAPCECSPDPRCSVDPIPEVSEPPAPKHPERYWKVAVIQCNEACHPIPCADKKQATQIKEANRKDLKRRITEAANKGAKIIVTPEFSVVGYPEDKPEWGSPEEIQYYVETVPGRSTDFFSHLASHLGVYIQIGFPEDGGDGCYYNAAVVLGPNGKIVAHYRKNCLCYGCGEGKFLCPGNDIATYDTPVGRVGVAICWDIGGNCQGGNDPLPRYYDYGVEILTVSSSWADCNSGWGFFKRAAENYHFYFLGSNQCYFPDAGVIGPEGEEQSHIRQSSGIAYGYLQLKIRPHGSSRSKARAAFR